MPRSAPARTARAGAAALPPLRAHLLRALARENNAAAQHLCGQRDRLARLLAATVAEGESNSVLVVGRRASGKSALVAGALEQVRAESEGTRLFIVRLDGAVLTDDKLAIREIVAQLAVGISEEDDQDEQLAPASFAERFRQVLALFAAQHSDTAPLVFVLDHFEHFAARARQTLIYTLFDLAQARPNVAVVGITPRLDIVDLLEKRVKSRFSHRFIYTDYPKDAKAYKAIAVEALHVDAKDPAASKWNAQVKDAVASDDFDKVLTEMSDFCKDIGTFQRTMHKFVTSSDEPTFSTKRLRDAFHATATTDTRAQLLAGVSTLELILLVAIKHRTALCEQFNFKTLYRVYHEWIFSLELKNVEIEEGKLLKGVRELNFTMQIVLRAFEGLVQARAVSLVRDSGLKEYRMYRSNVSAKDIERLVESADAPTVVKQWARK